MSKKLLEESTIRQFMKLAQLEPLSDNFLKEGERKKAMREEEMEEENIRDAGMTAPPVKGLGKKETLKATEKADKEARDKIEKKPGNVQKEEIALEEELGALFEEELSEMGDMYEGDMVYEEEDENVEMEEGDAEINITPDQARAIIAVADMLKDIMPDLEEPEAEEEMDMEDEEEMDMDMDMDVDAEEEEGAEEEEEGAEEEAEGEEEEALAEAVMRRVKARLREMKNK